MLFNKDVLYNFSAILVPEAESYIKSNDREGLKELIKTHAQLAVAPVHLAFNNSTPLYKIAIDLERDDMAVDLYKASPFEVKQYVYKVFFNNLTIYTDFLGAAIIGKRHELVETLLDFKDEYKFDINGMKNTNNILANFYHISNKQEDMLFSDYDPYGKYISSPLMISILIGDFKMYEIFKKRGAYFNINNDNCKFHLDLCENEAIKNDINNFFKLEEEL